MDLSHLRRKVGCITQRNARTHESVFGDLVTTKPEKAYRVRALCALFDDESMLGNMILKRLDR